MNIYSYNYIPDDVSGGHHKVVPYLHQDLFNLMRQRFFHAILQHQGHLLHHCNETSVLYLTNNHLAFRLQSRLISEKRVVYFGPPCNEMHSFQSGYHVH